MPRTRKNAPPHPEVRARPAAFPGADAPFSPDPEPAALEGLEETELMEAIERGLPVPTIPTRFPILVLASGLYEWRFPVLTVPGPVPVQPFPVPIPPADHVEEAEVEEVVAVQRAGLTPLFFRREELRLDVDGWYPQMVVSGTIYSGPTMRVHWIANLSRTTAANLYTGHIWYRDGDVAWMPYTNVRLAVTKSLFANQREVIVRFTGAGAPALLRTYKWVSATYHPIEFEYDTVAGTTKVTELNTGDHPNRPPSLPVQNLSIETVYRRAGFNVSKGADTVVPLSGAGPNAMWSNMEMHDAMQIHWSRFANKPQWALWVLFAGLHEMGTSLGGIMFDDIGPNHRQGTALFNDSFIKNPPAGDPAPAAWVRRMKFWTAVHEMGHAFNLAHSWQKALVFQGKGPWIPLMNEPEARSFMNYPYNVAGGQAAFFADFEFRFTDGELLFLRHAPERFVQPGNALWFDHHGFKQAETAAGSAYRLELRTHRQLPYFEFMEPVAAELKLTNSSAQPVLVNAAALAETDALTVIVKKRDQAARQVLPYAQYCFTSDRAVLTPGESLYAPLRLGGCLGGWAIAEPGYYTVQVLLRIGNEDVVSNPIEIRVAPPRGFEEELLGQDFFSDDVGRVLEFGGSLYMRTANDTLRTVTDQLGTRRVARHARLALANPLMREYKELVIAGEEPITMEAPVEKVFRARPAEPAAARVLFDETLFQGADEAAETLGHIEYRNRVEQCTRFLADQGEPVAAANSIDVAAKALKGRKVLNTVVQEMEGLAAAYRGRGGQKTH
jgi:hypothetical protein